METFESLMEEVKRYIHKEENLQMIEKAYNIAAKCHEGQVRKSGEPYIIHPIAVAKILATLNTGPETICAGLLHDVIEDTDYTIDDLTNEFNQDIALMVDGVSKITQMKFTSLEKQQATNHQKMILAMSKDIRVIVIKLADRLHNMRTLEFQPQEKQVRISNETLEIYAPLAHKIGMFKVKAELEDTALKYINRPMYDTISGLIDNKINRKDGSLAHMLDAIKDILKDNVKDYEIKGRIKNQYSIYKKMVNQEKSFEDIYDILAIRIIVDRVEECYQVLGLIHAKFAPIPKRFKDYIAVPKPNMYQSLHTTILGVDGDTFEIQIRTHEMDEIAELGIAAHWAYKENAEYSKDKEQYEIAQKLKWYGDLLSLTSDSDSSAEDIVTTFKDDILDSNIYVYTPKGEVISLPTGSTPLDFAYKIHTEIGNKTVGAIVNNKIVPLSYELQTGDIISMRINKNSIGPSEDWLKIVKTNHAKNKIKNFLNKLNRDTLYQMGYQDVSREMDLAKISMDKITDDFVRETFSKNNVTTAEDMFVEVGKGILSSKTVVAKLSNETLDREAQLQRQLEKANRVLTTNSDTGVVVEGLSNPQIKLANCCLPLPGDRIVGFVSKGQGIVVHRHNCMNVRNLERARLLDLDWATFIDRKYPVNITITATQSNSLIMDVINTINAMNMSVAQINSIPDSNLQVLMHLKLLAKNKSELDVLFTNLKKVEGVAEVIRE